MPLPWVRVKLLLVIVLASIARLKVTVTWVRTLMLPCSGDQEKISGGLLPVVKLLLLIVLASIAREKFATTSKPGATVLTPLAPSAGRSRVTVGATASVLKNQPQPLASGTP